MDADDSDDLSLEEFEAAFGIAADAEKGRQMTEKGMARFRVKRIHGGPAECPCHGGLGRAQGLAEQFEPERPDRTASL